MAGLLAVLGYIAGLGGIWWLIQNIELQYFSVSQSAIDWKAAGSTLNVSSNVVKTLCKTADEFNDFMEEIFESRLVEELKVINETTGMLEIPDLTIVLPNGLAFKIIESSEVANFRISTELGDWSGFIIPWLSNRFLACRVRTETTFNFPVPGTEAMTFIDPLDGQVRLGSLCTPPQRLEFADVETLITWIFCITCFMYFLKGIGAFGILRTYYNRCVLNNKFRSVSHSISDVEVQIADITTELDNLKAAIEPLQADWFSTSLSVNNSKVTSVFEHLKRLGYRPYG